jgi:hypothetical protein
VVEDEAIDLIQETARRDGTGDEHQLKEPLMEVLRQTFRPEFRNRIDETVVFHDHIVVEPDGETFSFRKEAPAAVAS